jgi:hypothetical protein
VKVVGSRLAWHQDGNAILAVDKGYYRFALLYLDGVAGIDCLHITNLHSLNGQLVNVMARQCA